MFCYLRIQTGQSITGFVRDENEVRNFNHCEEERDVISFATVIAQSGAQLLDTEVNKVKRYAEQAAV